MTVMFSSGKHDKLVKHGILTQISRPLTHPKNPILESVRADAAIIGLGESVGEHLAELDDFFANSPTEDFGTAIVNHARAVLTRLATE